MSGPRLLKLPLKRFDGEKHICMYVFTNLSLYFLPGSIFPFRKSIYPRRSSSRDYDIRAFVYFGDRTLGDLP